MAKTCLTVRLTNQTETQVGHSDPTISVWNGRCLTDKRYARDNRLMFLESSYRKNRLAPRCRLITSWSSKRFQGLDCSSIKVVRELGLERRETVRFLSTDNLRKLKYSNFITKGPRRVYLWCSNCFSKSNVR
jgi:hypothetical protein